MEIFGIRLVGLTAQTGWKLLLSLGLVVTIILLRLLLRWLVNSVVRGDARFRLRFWLHQAISLLCAASILILLVSIWFDDPARLTTAAGLVTAGLAFALQRVITAIAGYFVILRGKNFTVGDRIVMGGVRGDVVALGFIQTTIMEMGQPPPVENAEPAMWVHSRQFTGRIVTVNNGQIFIEPIFNYTRDFPYIWEELQVPISYQGNRKRAEEILLDSTRRHALTLEKLGNGAAKHLEDKFHVQPIDIDPKVYYRLTDNWIELSIRFLFHSHDVRLVKDTISREVLAAFESAGIGIASSTFEITGVPPLQIKRSR